MEEIELPVLQSVMVAIEGGYRCRKKTKDLDLIVMKWKRQNSKPILSALPAWPK